MSACRLSRQKRPKAERAGFTGRQGSRAGRREERVDRARRALCEAGGRAVRARYAWQTTRRVVDRIDSGHAGLLVKGPARTRFADALLGRADSSGRRACLTRSTNRRPSFVRIKTSCTRRALRRARAREFRVGRSNYRRRRTRLAWKAIKPSVAALLCKVFALRARYAAASFRKRKLTRWARIRGE